MRRQAHAGLPRLAIPHWNGRRHTRCDILVVRGDGRRRRYHTEREAVGPGADRLDQLREKGAAEHRDLGVGVPLQGIEGEGQPQRRAALEVHALGERQLQLPKIRALVEQFDPGEIAVALDERTDARIRERIGVWCRRGRGGARLGLGLRLAAAGHAVSAWISTSTRGKWSTCATSVIARPELVKPVRLTSSPYCG